MSRRLTPLMLQAQGRVGMPLRDWLIANYGDLGLPGCAEKMGVSKATAWYWLVRFGLTPQKTLVPIGKGD